MTLGWKAPALAGCPARDPRRLANSETTQVLENGEPPDWGGRCRGRRLELRENMAQAGRVPFLHCV